MVIADKIFEILEEKDIDFDEVREHIMRDGAIDSEAKRLIAIACAAAIDCDFCVEHHVELAHDEGIGEERIKEAILVASLVGFGSRAKNLAVLDKE